MLPNTLYLATLLTTNRKLQEVLRLFQTSLFEENQKSYLIDKPRCLGSPCLSYRVSTKSGASFPK